MLARLVPLSPKLTCPKHVPGKESGLEKVCALSDEQGGSGGPEHTGFKRRAVSHACPIWDSAYATRATSRVGVRKRQGATPTTRLQLVLENEGQDRPTLTSDWTQDLLSGFAEFSLFA